MGSAMNWLATVAAISRDTPGGLPCPVLGVPTLGWHDRWALGYHNSGVS